MDCASVAPEDAERVRHGLREAEKTGRGTIEYRFQCKDGIYRWLADYFVVQKDEEGLPLYYSGSIRDITGLKQAEEALHDLTRTLELKVSQRTAELRHRAKQLQKLTLEMSEVEERERRRMAEILHDDLQQQLAAAKFHLSLVRSQVRQDSSLREITTQIDRMLKDAVETSRSLSHELSPAVLHLGNFAETLRRLADEVQAKHGLVVHVQGQMLVEATRQIKADWPQIRVVALSMYNEPAAVENMQRAGAESYVLKTAPFDELLAVIRGESLVAGSR